MLNNFCAFEELVFFDLWIPDSRFRFVSGFRFPGFRIAHRELSHFKLFSLAYRKC